MITLNFIHDSFPMGKLKIELPVVPASGEIVYLDETLFLITRIDHIVYSVPHVDQDAYVAYLHLMTSDECNAKIKNDRY